MLLLMSICAAAATTVVVVVVKVQPISHERNISMSREVGSIEEKTCRIWVEASRTAKR